MEMNGREKSGEIGFLRSISGVQEAAWASWAGEGSDECQIERLM